MNDERREQATASRNLTYEGRCEIEHGGHLYQVEFDCDVQLSRFGREPFVMIASFEAEIGGKPVNDRALRREISVTLCEWVSNHRETIIRQSK